jgi:hypothetical protein
MNRCAAALLLAGCSLVATGPRRRGDVLGITFGLITFADEFVTLSPDALSISPAAPPWDR